MINVGDLKTSKNFLVATETKRSEIILQYLSQRALFPNE